MKNSKIWELVSTNSVNKLVDITERLKTPTGWIVRTTLMNYEPGIVSSDVAIATSMINIEDGEHEWEIPNHPY